MGILRLPARLRFRGVVGTGGIGHGAFFALDGDETLGREESRSGRLLDRRDYCKLHIISHYLKVLLGDAFGAYPIGAVGSDDAGTRLCAEMRDVGIDLRFVRPVPGCPTLYSLCLLYPDGSGGNLTTADSAASRVDASSIGEAHGVMQELGREGIALAVPEVPLAARRALLEQATSLGLFRAAGFTRAEMPEVRDGGLLDMVDLCAMNLEEAAAAAEMAAEAVRSATAAVAEQAAALIRRRHPRLVLSITAGRGGSWCADASGLAFDPPVAVPVEGTSGAGDAHLSGLLAGLAAGLPTREALQLGTIVAAASVMSPHTIHPSLTREVLRWVRDRRGETAAGVSGLLDSDNAGS